MQIIRRDIDDTDDLIDDIFGRQQADRMRAEREEKRAENERIAQKNREVDEAMAAQRAVRQNHLAQESTRRSLIAGYERYNVEAPQVDDDGIPTISIDLLFKLGWRIRNTEFGLMLIRPETQSPAPTNTEGT